MRILELFAGIGACSTALKRLGIDLEIVDAVEIDKYAMASFNVIHGTNFEPQDITKWNKELKDIDIITHGSPCQDFSIAGKQAGGDIGSGTRSSLMYETIRIVGQIRPKYVLWENVRNILSAKHKHNFDAYIDTMNVLGYNSYYQVLNAKDYGIPQNRERVYTISIRKDIDKGYTFPVKEQLKLRLKDMLEDVVDEKYYLDDAKINKIVNSNFMQEKKRIQEKEYADTILARDWKDPKCVQVGQLDIKGQDIIKRVYSDEGLSPTLTDMQGGNRQPKIITHNIIKKVYVRKYPVDVEKLKMTLREAKLEKDVTNEWIADIVLNIPETTVEHWFRKDDSFAIPTPDVWFKLKKFLEIKTDEFDESIMTFEEKDNVYEKGNRVYDEDGLAPTLTQQEEKILIKNATQKGYDEAIDGDSVNLQYPDSNTRRGRVGHQVSQTIMVKDNMGVVEKKIIYEQPLERKGWHHKACEVLNANGMTTCIHTQSNNLLQKVKEENTLRIRKLTPKECWRLMRI